MNTPAVCPLTHRDDAAPDLPPDRYVCARCTATLRGLLTDLPGLMADIEDATAKRLRFGGTAVRRQAADHPLPLSLAASDAGWVARQTLLAWTDWITAVRGHRVPDTWREVGDYLAGWHRGAIDWVSRHPDGPVCVDELTAALRQARAAVDRPAERQYAGPCTATTVDDDGLAADCTGELYARPGATEVACPECGAVYPLAQRRAWLLEQAEDRLLPAAELARAVDGLGVVVTSSTVRSWVRRGRLVARGRTVTAGGRAAATYRVGDVLDLVRAGATTSHGRSLTIA